MADITRSTHVSNSTANDLDTRCHSRIFEKIVNIVPSSNSLIVIVVEKRRYQLRPARYEYWLTDKGKALFDVLYAMRNWAERWAYAPGETGGDGPAMRYVHRKCGADVGLATICPECGDRLGYGDLKGEMSPALLAERTARATA